MEKPTIRELILKYVKPKGKLTARDIQSLVEFSGEKVALASLSSLLKKMCDEGELIREDGHGPRGGHGYTRKKKSDAA